MSPRRDWITFLDPIGYALVSVDVGRWTVRLLNFGAIGCWSWRRNGYDCLWEEWGLGFLLQLERETDYLRTLAEGREP